MTPEFVTVPANVPVPLNVPPAETVVTVEFFAKGDSTDVVLTHTLFASNAVRHEHEVGWNGCFDILEKTLQQQ